MHQASLERSNGFFCLQMPHKVHAPKVSAGKLLLSLDYCARRLFSCRQDKYPSPATTLSTANWRAWELRWLQDWIRSAPVDHEVAHRSWWPPMDLRCKFINCQIQLSGDQSCCSTTGSGGFFWLLRVVDSVTTMRAACMKAASSLAGTQGAILPKKTRSHPRTSQRLASSRAPLQHVVWW